MTKVKNYIPINIQFIYSVWFKKNLYNYSILVMLLSRNVNESIEWINVKLVEGGVLQLENWMHEQRPHLNQTPVPA